MKFQARAEAEFDAKIGAGAPFPRHLHLRLVERPPGPQRLLVRIAASGGLAPFGRSKLFHLHERDLAELVAVAERLEARR